MHQPLRAAPRAHVCVFLVQVLGHGKGLLTILKWAKPPSAPRRLLLQALAFIAKRTPVSVDPDLACVGVHADPEAIWFGCARHCSSIQLPLSWQRSGLNLGMLNQTIRWRTCASYS